MDQEFLWNADIVGQVTQGKAYGDWGANAICIDTRKISKGDIFVAFKGAVDGHDYVSQALKAGANAAIVEYIPKNISPEDCNLVVVKDSTQAIKDLAEFNRRRTEAKIIAVTGSVGKTSTKEALYAAFSALGKAYCSQGNYNNELGLPISLASLPQAAEYAIFEMGMNHAGELERLTKLLQPDAAIITSVEPVHLEYFASVEDIAKAKAEIFLGMNASSVAVLNGDNKYYDILRDAAQKCSISKILTFGGQKANDSYCASYKNMQDGTLVNALISGREIEYKIAAYGEHQVINTIATLSIVQALGLDIYQASKGLLNFANVKGRGKTNEVNFAKKKLLLIDESYNASPRSMKAALAALQDLDQAKGRRKLAILADMYELGDDAIKMHTELLQDITDNGVDKVITVGSLMHNLFEVIPDNIKLMHFVDYKSAINNIDRFVNDQDCILVKGSFGTKIHELVNYLENNQ